MKYLILIGWVIFIVFVLVFNYRAHKTDQYEEENKYNRRKPYCDDDNHIIF